MALNTSAIYLGQALGAGGGGLIVAGNLAAHPVASGAALYDGLQLPVY